MTVLVFLFLGLSFLVFAGYGFTRLLCRRSNRSTDWRLILVNGYCLSVILFSELTRVLHSAQFAFYGVFAVCAILNGRSVYFWFKERHADPSPNLQDGFLTHLKSHRAIYSFAFLFILIVSVSFVSSGWNNFWGSANGDVFDGLRGRDVLLSDPSRFFNERMGYYDSDPNAWYQYSSLAFWSILFGSYNLMNIFYLQELLMIFLLPLGIYYLCETGFRFNHGLALLSAMLASMSAFYVSTYFTGHEGSLIFGAVLPFLLGLMLRVINSREITTSSLAFVTVWLYTLVWSYPYPLVYILVPLALYLFFRVALKEEQLSAITRNILNRLSVSKIWMAITGGRRYSILVVAALFLLLALVTYWLFEFFWSHLEPIRLRASQNYRAWGISQYKEMILIYFGIVPSQIPFGLGGFIRLYSPFLVSLGFFLSGVYIAGSLFGLWTLLKTKNSIRFFFLLYAIFWVFSFLFMKYAVVDSYYFYKFLYTNYFMSAIFLASGAIHLYEADRQKRIAKILARGSAVALCCLYVATNLVFIAIYNSEFLSRPYNTDISPALSQVKSLKDLEKGGLYYSYRKENFYDDYGNIVNYILERNDIELRKVYEPHKYRLEVKPVKDVFLDFTAGNEAHIPTVWENDAYRVESTRNRDILVPVDKKFRALADSWYGPEKHEDVYNAYPLRWVSYKIDFFLVNPTNDLRYLSFCVEPGPGLDFRPFLLYIYLNEEILDSVYVSGLQSVNIPLPTLENRVNSIRLVSREKGKNFLPWEERYINYRVASVQVTNEQYRLQALRLMNNKNDIVPEQAWHALRNKDTDTDSLKELLCVWNGWQALEKENGNYFRWVNNDAELLLLNPTVDSRFLNLFIERGPALQSDSANLSVYVNNELTGTTPLTDYLSLKIKLPVMKQKKNVVKLHLDKTGKPLKHDPRILDFRVYRAYVTKE